MDDQNMPAPVDGAIVHIEIYAEDLQEARKFYGGCFGWTFKEWGDTSNYVLFMDAAGKLGGGFTKESNTGAGGILLYIYCIDLDAKIKQVDAAGGRILEGRTPIPGVGFFATFVDPFGNHIGLFTAQ